jgi:hypothetical protein
MVRKPHFKKFGSVCNLDLTLIVLAFSEAEIRIVVRSQTWANSSPDPILKIPNAKKGLAEWLKW